MSHRQNAGQNLCIKVANKSSKNVAKFKYLGMTVINHNDIHEEIKRRSNSGNARYHAVQDLLSFCLI
jgi:hypothetical protein